MKLAPSDEPAVHSGIASDDWKEKSYRRCSTGSSDDLSGDTVSLSDAWFESRQRCAKTDSSAQYELTPWSEEASVYPTVLKKPIEMSRREVLQHQMNRCTISI
jgi:hypothetical protein